MQQAAPLSPASSSAVNGFAALLSTLLKSAPESAGEAAAPEEPAAERCDECDDGLDDDIATLSYEQAMRSQARYRASTFDDQMLAGATEPGWNSKAVEAAPVSVCRASHSPRQSRKSASVTVRLSSAEYEQLHQRAAEAGLTVSAYLRSCTFEAESLRAQVKETLALLRSAADSSSPSAVSASAQGQSWVKSLRLGWPRRSSAQAVK